ncbi:MAG TPA: hypothetical protein ENN90_02240 [Mariniphaga anaerophila]|uniref:CarboxypepD_reg-like domain-containing protein n=1 Tax=Mariniphaga anaerophila TaxID=1484053 RepID=A0A831LIU0_9BACT|nr:hypothetical protein [Mariniphaga anaerophila]
MNKHLSFLKTHVFQVKSSIKHAFIFMLFAGFCFNTQAQVIEITGRVTSKTDGKPLPRVQVLVKGTDASVTTDARGDYTIRANASGTLVFSNAGMKTWEEPVRNRQNINVAMEPVKIEAKIDQAVVVIPGNVPWKNTGIVLQPNDKIELKATGQVCFSGDDPDSCVDPEGWPRKHYWQDWPGDWGYCDDPVGGEYSGHEGHAGLIAKVGSDIFFVGKGKTIGGKKGALSMGINDCTFTGDYSNSGQFSVVIKVTRGAP